jgi:murein DD-endopeptidase MepM/ murein hydrolase activator NlpD
LGKYLPTGNKEQDEKLPGMGGVFASANLGMYSYAWNRPVIMKDPDGNFTNPVEIMTIRSHQGDNLNPRSNMFGNVRTNRDGTPRPHQGIDLRAVNGTKTFAVGDGRIVDIDRAGSSDYGMTITYEFTYKYSIGNFLYDLFTFNWGGIGEKISNSGKKYFAIHAHLSSIDRNLRVGTQVKEGQVLGRTGSTGNARNLNRGERHLHFEMRNRNPVGRGLGGRFDPAPFMQGLNSNPKDNRSDNQNEWH